MKRDFRNKYLASLVGFSWTFIQPLVTIVVMWFAFTIGLRIQPLQGDIPFTPWLLCGLIPWFFINDSLITTSQSLIEYSYLIKKTTIKPEFFPLIKIFNSIIIHIVFIIVLMIIILLYGYRPNVYWFQVLYLVMASMILLTGIGWLTSALYVFLRDIGPLLNVTLAIMFWATPIIWSYSTLAGNFKYLALLNPFFYIIEGYRYAFLYEAWMFGNLEMTLYFWAITLLLYVLGRILFKILRPHFADVL